MGAAAPCGVGEQIGWSLQSGYRLVDTAQRYENEAGIGDALAKAMAAGTVSREELFVTTKVWVEAMGYEQTLRSIDKSLAKLRLSYVDLLLLHWPGDFGQTPSLKQCRETRLYTWRAMEQAMKDGRVRNIGVANFGKRHLLELLEFAEVRPAVNQFEVHPFNTRTELVELCQREGIQVMGYSPLGGRNGGGPGTGVTDELLQHPTLTLIAANHGKTSAQVMLRWQIQRGITPIPKASSSERLAENFNVFDFDLLSEEMALIGALDRGAFVVFDDEELP
eukprot:CAMPEP_0203927574 /NCGR_PEP_ID=MMETSP0359-20131031/66977_1 /ASSEMBLY_ACC=CAM_ASM_000338 /TAXON_ID=268821 /ORGANISM="Scrippsiella Hangoei, Strain SHTV-5" /LENGTH=277 /DNA_ID=CAMNT_0050856363 /DNA_START=397 /DNA_END=1230 /DNA_ORIENTATION=-